MPSKIVKGDDGKMYIEMPGVGRFPMEGGDNTAPAQGGGDSDWLAADPSGKSDMMLENAKMLGRGVRSAATNPEVVGGIAGTLASGGLGGVPLLASAGARMAVPPIVAALMSVLNDARAGTDGMSMAGDALGHAGLNLIPGVAGQFAKGAKASSLAKAAGTGGTTLKERAAKALIAGGESKNWLGTLASTLGNYMTEAAPTLPTKIGKGGLMPSGVANVHGRDVATTLRALLAGLSTAKGAGGGGGF